MSGTATSGFQRRSRQVDSIRKTREWERAVKAAESLESDMKRSLIVKLLAGEAKLHRERADWCRRHGRGPHQDETRQRMAAFAEEALVALEDAERKMGVAMVLAKDLQIQRGGV